MELEKFSVRELTTAEQIQIDGGGLKEFFQDVWNGIKEVAEWIWDHLKVSVSIEVGDHTTINASLLN